MRVTALLAFLFTASIASAQYSSMNMSLLSTWNDTTVQPEPNYAARYSGCYGWVAPDGKEYAIIGSTKGTYFLNITNPASPVVCDFVAGRNPLSLWRESKTYRNYCYMVSDDAPPNSLQIADLSYLPDSVHLVYDSDSIFTRSHTIYIDGDKLYCGSVTTASDYYSMAVYSLADPIRPLLLRTLNQDYFVPGTVHDMFVRNDTVYASGGYEGLYIYKFSGNEFQLLQSLTSYPDQGYNHSSYLTPDARTLIMCDEVPEGLGVKALDVSDLGNITPLSVFESHPRATPHNPYVVSNSRAVIAYYQDGLQVYDISDPANPARRGYFDTHPQNGLNNNYPDPPYQGCWGAYPWLPSGNIIASDMQNGLFVLNASLALGADESPNNGASVYVFPNPFSSRLSVSMELDKAQEVRYELRDITGRVLAAGSYNAERGYNDIELDAKSISEGAYLLVIEGEGFSSVKKVIRTD